jgi:FixJ family two-component response regulator
MTAAARVLVIDDEPVVLRSCDRILTRQGMIVEGTDNGNDGLKRVSDQPFDVMLLDLKMPEISGVEVLRRVQAAELDLSVIIITGYPSVGSAVEAMKLGAFDYIVKPFEPEQLAETVRRAVTMRNVLKAAPAPEDQDSQPLAWSASGRGRSISTTTRDGRRVCILGLDGLFEARTGLCAAIVDGLKRRHAPSNVEYGSHEVAGNDMLTYLENFDTVVVVTRVPLQPEDGKVLRLPTTGPGACAKNEAYEIPQIGFPHLLHWADAIGIGPDLVIIAVDRSAAAEHFSLGPQLQQEILSKVLAELAPERDNGSAHTEPSHRPLLGPCQMIDVLERVRAFHEAISAVYATLRDKATDSSVRLLFDHMSRRQKDRAHNLKEYEELAPEGVLKSWYRFTPKCMAAEWIESLTTSPSTTMDEAVDLIVHVHDCLGGFYQAMAELATGQAARDVFLNLYELELQERIHVMCFIADR